MLKIYTLLSLTLVASSCSVGINYLGDSFEKTARVDVFVEPGAIKKPYTIIGKGYEKYIVTYGRNNIEKLQAAAVQKAKQKGADAILFQDYYLLQPGTVISSTVRTDTLTKATVTTGDAYVGPVVSSGRHILFLKYN